jgi:hypothetical protein
MLKSFHPLSGNLEVPATQGRKSGGPRLLPQVFAGMLGLGRLARARGPSAVVVGSKVRFNQPLNRRLLANRAQPQAHLDTRPPSCLEPHEGRKPRLVEIHQE